MRILLTMVFGIVLLAIITPIITYLVSCCLYVGALRDHFKSNFQKIDFQIMFDYLHLIEKVNKIDGFKQLITFHMQIIK